MIDITDNVVEEVKLGDTVIIYKVIDIYTSITDMLTLNKAYCGTNIDHLLMMAELEGYKYYVKQDSKLLVGGQ